MPAINCRPGRNSGWELAETPVLNGIACDAVQVLPFLDPS